MLGSISTPVLYALAAVGQLLTAIFVPLRCIARLRVVYRLALEDYLMIAAEIVTLAQGAITFLIDYNGAGKHIEDIPAEKARRAMFYWYLAIILYPITAMLVKLSISLLLLRLMAMRWQKIVIYIVIGITIAVTPVQLFADAFICIPPSAFWAIDFSKCNFTNFGVAIYVHAGVNIATDLVLAIMPAIVLARSQLPRKQKIATAAVLGIGTGSGFATVLRAVFVHTVLDNNDFLYASVWLGMATALESNLAITAGCLATFRPFFTKMKGRSVRPDDSVAPDGRLSFSKEMGAETIRGDWDPGLTINFEGGEPDRISIAPSLNNSRRSSDISLPIQTHKEFEHLPNVKKIEFRELIIDP